MNTSTYKMTIALNIREHLGINLRSNIAAASTEAVVSAWHAKAEIRAATGLTYGQWNAVIADLIAYGKVECQGEKHGARYQVVTEGTKE